MSARHALAVGVAFLLVLLVVPGVSAQVCRDLDGDGAEQGFTCLPGTDCEDLAWRRHPGAAETCDGLDNDCDADLDLGCDRYCDEKTLLPTAVLLQVEDLPQARGGCVGLFEDGILAVTRRTIVEPDRLYYGRGYDRLGVAMGPSSAVGDPSTPTPLEIGCRMAVAGDRALVSYHDEHERDDSLARLMARVVDRLGRPVTATPIDLSATSPVSNEHPWNDEHAVWDGERFYVFWTARTQRKKLLMSRIEADGTLADPATMVVTDNVNGLGERIQNIRAVWTGDHFVVIVSVDAASAEDSITLHTLKVTREAQVLARDTIPGRDTGPGPAIAMGNDRVAVLWMFFDGLETGNHFTRMVFTDSDGGYMTDPGVITLRQDPDLPDSGNKHLAWTGEMFGAAYATYEIVGVSGRAYEWYFSRVLPDGTILDPDGVLLSDDASLDNVWGLHWAGRNFWLYGLRGPQAFVRQKIMCDCSDADGDTFGACTGQDCDDTDPLANIAQLESCRGLTDDDCDGLVDCADTQDCPGGAGPGDITDVAWSGSTLNWSAPSGAERFDLARGLVSDLLRRGDLRQGDCAGLELAVPSWTDDGRDPPVGDVLWYAVRPEGQPCHLGSYGVGGVARESEVCR